jgi:hypothetical protein
MATKTVTEDVYPSISHPGAMTIDWLHNYTYIVDGLLVSLSTKLHCVFMSFRKPHVIGQKDDFGIETSSVNEAHNHSTMPTSRNYL